LLFDLDLGILFIFYLDRDLVVSLLLATVMILANDGSSGVINFDSNSVITLAEPSDDENSSPSVAKLRLIRGPGVFGLVNVPFEVVPEMAGDGNDLSPTQGFVTFQDREVHSGNCAFFYLVHTKV
jgi:hypothetical protein